MSIAIVIFTQKDVFCLLKVIFYLPTTGNHNVSPPFGGNMNAFLQPP